MASIANDAAERRRIEKQRKARSGRLINDFLPPEGVPIRFLVAGLGARFSAQLVDVLICVVFVTAILVLVGVAGGSGSSMMTLWALLFFAIRVPYYVAAELVWNGQTLGKRVMGIRVISGDGRGLTARAIVVRNLMKEFEVFVPGLSLLGFASHGAWGQGLTALWVLIVILVPLFSKRRQRLGDIIAGTYVIKRPQAILLPDITVEAPRTQSGGQERFAFLAHQLDHYGRYELQTLERVLRADHRQNQEAARRRRDNLIAIMGKVRAKIGYSELLEDQDAEEFLTAFYAAQRAYLEQRRLFGESREDKFHHAMPEGERDVHS